VRRVARPDLASLTAGLGLLVLGGLILLDSAGALDFRFELFAPVACAAAGAAFVAAAAGGRR